jgi:cell division septation protein DedD
MKKILLTIFSALIFSIPIIAQDVNIIPYLKQIESGDIEDVNQSLKELLAIHPNDPSVLFLDAVLTTNGEEALRKYIKIYDNFPKSKYADASLYRMFSYYYALGFYKKAENYLEKLKVEYPSSPYIDAADKNIPEEIDVFYEKEYTADLTKDPVTTENKSTVENYAVPKFTVQAGAFLDIKNAKELRNQLVSDGYIAELKTKDIGGSILNIVMVGKFNSESETGKLLSHLSTKYKLQGRIVSLN